MDDFDELFAIVDSDDSLQKMLLSLSDSAGFVATVLRLAVERGLVVSEGRIWQEIERGRAAWYASWTP